ncbi:MAG: hypothetical protein PSX36_12935 [bacterium]|nr:hypothetical protein [bacterium]
MSDNIKTLNKFDPRNWTLWRATRMILGFVFGIMGIMRSDYVLAAAGVFLIVHAWINHCAACVDNDCKVPEIGDTRKP